MRVNQTQHTPCICFRAANGLSHRRPQQINDHDPPGSDDMDMSRWMVVGVDDDSQSIDAQDRRHRGSLAKPKRSGKSDKCRRDAGHVH
jgi:hypothetical protein